MAQVNRVIRDCADNQHVLYAEIGDVLLTSDGLLSAEISVPSLKPDVCEIPAILGRGSDRSGMCPAAHAMRDVFKRIFIRSFAGSVTPAGLLAFAGAAAGAGPAHGQCRHQPYPALKQALDTYFAQRQKADGFSGVSLHVSLSPQGPDFDVAGGGRMPPELAAARDRTITGHRATVPAQFYSIELR